MKKEITAGAKKPGPKLSELIEKIQKATSLTQREIAVRAGYESHDYLSNMLIKEKKGQATSMLLIKKLIRTFEVELTGKKEFQEGNELTDGLVADLIAVKTTLFVVVRELAELRANLYGTSYENEYAALRGRTGGAVGSVLQKS